MQATVSELVKVYRTSDPFYIADQLNIHVRYADADDNFKGVYVPIDDKKLIVLNKSFKHTQENKFYMAHELYHAINHSDVVAYYHNGYQVKAKFEREANQFATYLCLVDTTIYEGQSEQEVMRANHIPLEMRGYLRSV